MEPLLAFVSFSLVHSSTEMSSKDALPHKTVYCRICMCRRGKGLISGGNVWSPTVFQFSMKRVFINFLISVIWSEVLELWLQVQEVIMIHKSELSLCSSFSVSWHRHTIQFCSGVQFSTKVTRNRFQILLKIRKY